jgi:hypothetical protein
MANARVSQEADGGMWVPVIVATCFVQDASYMDTPFGKTMAPMLSPHLDDARAGIARCKAEMVAANPQDKKPQVGVPKAMCDAIMANGLGNDFNSGGGAGGLYDQHAAHLKWLRPGECSKKQVPEK